MRFFDQYRRFYETTGTLLKPNRFQQRWRIIIDENKAVLRGARVLDIASHDGRWSFAVLKAGASYVEGVEARPELVARARHTFPYYGIAQSAYSFLCQDALQYLAASRLPQFDIVLLLGFFYHTLKHLEILENVERTGARLIIIDTGVAADEEPVIRVGLEDANDIRNAVDHRSSGAGMVPVGLPSREALRLMLDWIGFDFGEIDWRDRVADFTECEDYYSGARGTFLAARRTL